MKITMFRLFYTFVVLLLLFLNFWERATFLVTLVAIVVALFREKLVSFYFPPDLELTINVSPECFHEVTIMNTETRQIVGRETWLGVIVKNVGSGSAEGVEVYIDGIDSNAIQGFSNYKTIPLARSWTRDMVIKKLPPTIGFRFDICILRANAPQQLNFGLPYTPTALLNIQCASGTDTFFEFELKTFANNAAVSRKKVKVISKGNYIHGFKIDA